MMYSLRRLLDRITPTRHRHRRPARGTRPTCRPRLDPLEDRVLLANCLWRLQGNGFWTDLNNWEDCDGRTPQAGDDATISLANVVVTHTNATTEVNRLTLDGPNSRLHFSGNALTVTTALAVSNNSFLRVLSGTLTVPGPAPFTVTDATLDYQGGTINATPVLTNAGLVRGAGATNPAEFICHAACTLNGSLGAGQTIWVRGGGFLDATLTVAAGASNAGTIRLESINSSWASTLAVAGTGSFTNAGVIRANVGSGGLRVITGDLVNTGLIDVESTNTLLRHDAGIYEAAEGGIRGQAYMLDRVRITAAPPPGLETILLGGGQARLLGNNPAGTELWVQGNGVFGDATLTVAAGASNAGTIHLESINSSWASNVAVAGTGSFTNADNAFIRANRGDGGTRTFTGSLLNRGRIDAEAVPNHTLGLTGGVYEVDRGVIAGQAYVLDRVRIVTPPRPGLETILVGGDQTRLLGDNLAGTTLWVQGNGVFGDATLTVAAGASNAGTIRLESINSSWVSDLAVINPGGGTLTNVGVLETGLGSGGARTITALLVNYGTLRFWAAQTALTTTAAPQDHRGYLEVGTGARLWLEYMTVTESGTVVIYPAAEVVVTGRYVQNGANTATYLVGGTLRTGDAPIDVQSGLISAFGVIDGILRNGGLLEVAGAGTIGYLNITRDYIQFPSGTVNFDIASAGFASIDYDYMDIGGEARLDGLLRATLLGGFRPERGDYFALFFAGRGIVDDSRLEVINLPKGLGLYPYQSDGYYLLFAW